MSDIPEEKEERFESIGFKKPTKQERIINRLADKVSRLESLVTKLHEELVVVRRRAFGFD